MNPFDQFDAPQAASGGGGNPFDQFDAPGKPQSLEVGQGRTAFDQAMQGATFGFADEISDRLGALGASLYTGEKYDDLLKDARGSSKARMKAEWEQNPGTALTSTIGGGLLTGAAGATTKAGAAIGAGVRSGNLAARVAKGAAAGATSGAAYGAGTADDGNRLESAGQGALYGGLTGGAIPVAGAAFTGVKNAVVDTARGAVARSPEAVQDVALAMKQQAAGLYDQMRQVGATFKPAAVNGFLIPDIEKAVAKQGFIAGLNPKTMAIVEALRDNAAKGNLGLDTLDQYRRQLGRIGATEDGVSAGVVRKAIDDFVNGANASHLVSGNKTAIDLLNKGRQQYSRASRFEAVSDILTKADGDPNRIKAGLTRLVNKLETESNKGGFTPGELYALKSAARSTVPEKLLKMSGKFGIDLGTSFTPGNTVAPLIGGAINPAVPVAGTAARQAQKYIARGKAENLLKTIEGRGFTKAPGAAISPMLSAPAGAAAGALSGQGARPPAMMPSAPVRAQITPMSYTEPQQQSNTTPEPVEPTGDPMRRIMLAESAGDPNAKNPNSTASGLYQFTDATWRSMVNKYGNETGIRIQDKSNPKAQEEMAKRLASDNAQYMMTNLGQQPDIGAMYAAHFLGAPDAVKLIKAQGTNTPATKLFPKAASANRKIFYDKMRPRTVEEVYALLQSKVS